MCVSGGNGLRQAGGGCRGQGIEEIIEHERNGWLISNWHTPADAFDELVQGLSTLLGSPDLCSRWARLRAIRSSTA